MATTNHFVQTFNQYFQHIDSISALTGFCVGALLVLILLIIVLGKSKRELLVNELRLQQAEATTRSCEQAFEQIKRDEQRLTRENQQLSRENAALEAKLQGMEAIVSERDYLLEANKNQIEQRFELLASEILTEKSNLINHNHESTLKLMLQPFSEQLVTFKHRVDDIYDKESKDRQGLLKEIEHLKSLNQRISTDAINLTQALKGKTKLQGQWGEVLLESLLEQCGLRKGVEFETQVNLQNELGARRQPDIIVHLPGKRDVVIDSKVSLKAFTRAYAETDTEKRKQHITAHLDSVRRHVVGLAKKNYHQLEGIQTLDFVLLFIPVEGAFHMVVEHGSTLLHTAMRKNIILCSPSTLLAILRTVHYLWRLDKQNRNGLIIAKQAGSLYDKFVGFVESFEEIGQRLNQTQQAWQTAHKRISTGQGNLISRTEQLRELGVQTNRKLDDVLQEINHTLS
ncbi:DNA recombination protein RmuC [Desulfogranum japonicum]|uniref:DNA recombination protein RmuC n=1 Tax=Desulfogranum japonicum TaxID=231447 RepID=UPI00040778F7|nr:DNA recombination protein RmuC [Desulfogranum japonicum]